MKTTVIAYSYIRFSSQEQTHGDSLRRQIEARDNWLKRHPHVRLDRRARYTDKGKSGRGEHLHGAMGVFLAKVKAGEIARGSILIVENLDRLGRLPTTDQLTLFLDLIRAGITIVSTMDNTEYSLESLNGPIGMGLLIGSISIMKRAFDESETKSVRSKENWDQIRKNKKVGTKRVPGWIVVVDGRYKLNEERVAIVRRIFRLTEEGWGKDRITALFNQEGIEPWGGGKQKGRAWHDTYITKILDNPAVIGQFQWHTLHYDERLGRKVRKTVGDPIEGFFPRAIPQRLWDRVQAKRAARAKRPGRIGKKVRNLFTGVAYCSHTGFPMVFSNKNPSFFLKTSAVRRPRGKNLKPWPYEDFEKTVIDYVGEMDTTALVDPQVVPERAEMEEQIALLKAKSERIKESVGQMWQAVSGKPESEMALTRQILAEREAEYHKVTTELESLKQAHVQMSSASAKAEESLTGIKLLKAKRHDPQFRLRLRDELPQLIEAIFVDLDAKDDFALRFEMDGRVFGNTPASVLQKMFADAKKEFFKSGGKVRKITILFTTGVVRSIQVQSIRGKSDVSARQEEDRRGKLIREGKQTRLELEAPKAIENTTGMISTPEGIKSTVGTVARLPVPLDSKLLGNDRNIGGFRIEEGSKPLSPEQLEIIKEAKKAIARFERKNARAKRPKKTRKRLD
jgi:DNA invertase Pin-like site-specific DNA recombinase